MHIMCKHNPGNFDWRCWQFKNWFQWFWCVRIISTRHTGQSSLCQKISLSIHMQKIIKLFHYSDSFIVESSSLSKNSITSNVHSSVSFSKVFANQNILLFNWSYLHVSFCSTCSHLTGCPSSTITFSIT